VQDYGRKFMRLWVCLSSREEDMATVTSRNIGAWESRVEILRLWRELLKGLLCKKLLENVRSE
jgi:hypothetical protein